MPRPDLVSCEDLEKLIDKRLRAVVDAMVDVDLTRFTEKMSFFEVEALRLGARSFGAHVATKAAVDKVQVALSELEKAFA